VVRTDNNYEELCEAIAGKDVIDFLSNLTFVKDNWAMGNRRKSNLQERAQAISKHVKTEYDKRFEYILSN